MNPQKVHFKKRSIHVKITPTKGGVIFMGKHYSREFKEKFVEEYKSGEYGGYERLAKKV